MFPRDRLFGSSHTTKASNTALSTDEMALHDGDAVYMSLNGANPFDYLTELQRHAEDLTRNPAEWMPWNFRCRTAES
jgi:hypothetical protein